MKSKILIIDEKDQTQKESSDELMEKLNKEQRDLVDLHSTSDKIWQMNQNEDSIDYFLIDLDQYSFIFLHQSYDDPILNDPRVLLGNIPDGTKLILFSGERSEGLKYYDEEGIYTFPQIEDKPHYEIRRSVYFVNFSSFLDTYLLSGIFRIEALYDRNFSIRREKAKKLFKQIELKLEESEKAAAESDEFSKFFELAGYENKEINQVIDNYKIFNYNKFIEALENELSKL